VQTPLPNEERQHYGITLAALTVAATAYALQQTMIAPALPVLQRDLHTTTTWTSWLLTGFLLSSAVSTPLLGKLGDQHGKQRLLLVTLTFFFAGCVGAIFAWNIWSLIGFRVIQGVGEGIFPLAFAIIIDEFPSERAGLGMGLISATFGVGGGLGLVLSGLIVDNLSWRWLFVVGSAGVALAFAAVWRFVPESPITTPSRLDLRGAALLSAALICFLLPMSEADHWGWSSARVVALFAVSACALVVFALVELRVPEPMVDMHVLARRPVLIANLTALIAGFGLFGAFILIPNFVETPRGFPAAVAHLVHYGFGASPTRAGLYLLPGTLGGFVTGPLAPLLARRFGDRVPLSLGMLISAAGMAILATLHRHPWQVILAMAVIGTGIPFAFAIMPKLIGEAVSQAETGVANGINTVMRTVGGVIGGQVGATILASRTLGRTGIPAESAYSTAFWVSAGGLAAAVLIALFATSGRQAASNEPPERSAFEQRVRA